MPAVIPVKWRCERCHAEVQTEAIPGVGGHLEILRPPAWFTLPPENEGQPIRGWCDRVACHAEYLRAKG